MCGPIHPIQCIIPPHMLDVMMLRGDKKTASMASSLMKQGTTMRESRAAMGGSVMVASKPKRGIFVTSAMSEPAAEHNLNRRIYDGQNRASLPGRLARKEGDEPVDDDAVNEAYDGAGEVYDLYFEEYKRDSLDGNGLTLTATVHHRRNYNNAFWNGSQMAYGDGDQRIFRKFTELSVVGHEMSHGVVQFSGGLQYSNQSGALNESFADCFGALTVQRAWDLDAADADWLIGPGILGDDINGVALRSMKAPGTAYDDALLGQDPQPYHMDLYVDTQSDNGGVHINSGIPNHAFYLYAQYLGGKAWKKAGRVWYRALQSLNNPLATFQNWAEQTVDTALDVFKSGSMEVLYLRRAWKLVGIDV